MGFLKDRPLCLRFMENLNSTEGVVEEVDQEEFSITIAGEGCWREDLPLLTPKGPMDLVHVEPDKLWGTTPPEVKPGEVVRQEISP